MIRNVLLSSLGLAVLILGCADGGGDGGLPGPLEACPTGECENASCITATNDEGEIVASLCLPLCPNGDECSDSPWVGCASGHCSTHCMDPSDCPEEGMSCIFQGPPVGDCMWED